VNRVLSVALLVVGVALIVWGFRASESISSDVSRWFTGTPTDRAVWFLLGGLAAAIVGGIGLLRTSRRS
jgi:hypothetical protein